MAQGEMFLGRYEQALSHLEQAMRISPRDSSIGVWHMDMGRDLPGPASNRCGGPGRPQSHRLRVSTGVGLRCTCGVYSAADNAPEAKAALAEAMKLNPKLSVAWLTRASRALSTRRRDSAKP